jgi:hypothetical protein
MKDALRRANVSEALAGQESKRLVQEKCSEKLPQL